MIRELHSSAKASTSKDPNGPSTSYAKNEANEEEKYEIEMKPKIKKEKSKEDGKHKKRKRHYSTTSEESKAANEDGEEKKPEPIDQEQLLENMREEHNLKFKTGILSELRADESIKVFLL